MNKTCLSYWFPLIEKAGLPVPKTELIYLSRDAQRAFFEAFNGKPIGEAAMPFLHQMRETAERIGLPCFLRTGQTSAKHQWESTCYLSDVAEIGEHILALIDFSECADKAWNVWVIRELLPTKRICTLLRYGNMPLCREFRAFIRGDKVVYVTPYWPEDAIKRGFPVRPTTPAAVDRYRGRNDPSYYDLPTNFDAIIARAHYRTANDWDAISDLASRAGTAVGGDWSVDILDTARGWYVTDMAEAEKSFGYRRDLYDGDEAIVREPRGDSVRDQFPDAGNMVDAEDASNS